MSDVLFSFGVFGDERTPRKRAEKPVRCMEDELLPVIHRASACGRCRTNKPMPHDTLCSVCRRERDYHLRTVRVRSAERLAARALRDGFTTAGGVHPDALDYCLERKWIKRASVRDLRRLGLSADDHVFLPVPNAK